MNAMSAIFMHGLPEDKTEIKLNGLNTARALIQRENNKGWGGGGSKNKLPKWEESIDCEFHG